MTATLFMRKAAERTHEPAERMEHTCVPQCLLSLRALPKGSSLHPGARGAGRRSAWSTQRTPAHSTAQRSVGGAAWEVHIGFGHPPDHLERALMGAKGGSATHGGHGAWGAWGVGCMGWGWLQGTGGARGGDIDMGAYRAVLHVQPLSEAALPCPALFDDLICMCEVSNGACLSSPISGLTESLTALS